MALESATYISGLVTTNPTGSDSISQGDDHIRLIKTVLKNSLPNVTTATTPVVSVTHAIQSSSSYMRSTAYIDSGLTISHNKLSATSTLYVQLNMFINYAFNFEHADYIQSYIKLTGSTGTLIVGTTNDLNIIFTDSVGQPISVSWDGAHGYSRLWKVTAANCPDATTGSNAFKIYQKINNADDGGVTFSNGTMMIWEIEE